MKKAINKFMAFLIAAMMIFGTYAIIGVDFSTLASATSVNDLVFLLINGGTEYEVYLRNINATGSITIPSTYDGKPVTSIKSYAFSYCTGLSTVTIPDSVTSIGEGAFNYCTGLSTVTIPDSVTSIGEKAFHDTAWYYNQPNGLLYLGKFAYAYKGTIPAGTSIVIRDGTKGIAYCAFNNCTGLSSVTIPQSVKSIGTNAFSYCTGLSNIKVSSANANYSSQDGVLFNKDKTYLIQYPTGNTRNSYSIPYSVTSINDHAFYNCTGLSSITIPDSVESIGYNAFCETAWYNNQPDGLVHIGKVVYAYKGTMPAGTAIVIEDGTKSFTDNAFFYCTGLSSITIPDSVTSIGNRVFYSCTGLSSVTIGNGVTSIGEWAFMSCTGLRSVTIGDSVESIGEDAFSSCTGLCDIMVSSANENYSSQDGVFFNKDKTCLLRYPCGNTRTSYAIPNSVTSIGEGAFNSCTRLRSVTIPDSVTSIGDSAFLGCTGISSITIPDSVMNIGNGAFYRCEGLRSVTIDNGVTSIGDSAFFDCTGLSSITVPDSVTSIGYWAFAGTGWYSNQPDGIVYIGKAAYAYKGIMPDGTSIVIKDGTKCIVDYAFYRCTGIVSITIPDSVTSIGNSAFASCASLSSITIPDSVMNIGNGAFYGCTNLSDVSYGGDENDRAMIKVGYVNEELIDATWHYSVRVIGVTLDITSKTLIVEGKQQLTATAAPDNATNKNVTWTSSDTAIASVDDNGLVTAIAEGTATITVTTEDRSKTASCLVTVKENRVEKIDILTPPNTVTYTYQKGSFDKTGLSIQATYSNGDTETITDTSIIDVTGFNANQKGVQKLTVEYGDCETNITVTVKYSVLQWLIVIFLFGWIWF